jgi:hypothetical protein
MRCFFGKSFLPLHYMADLNEAFRFPNGSQKTPVVECAYPKYDTTCPKCKGGGYAVTNDGGSLAGCTKCNIMYKSVPKSDNPQKS